MEFACRWNVQTHRETRGSVWSWRKTCSSGLTFTPFFRFFNVTTSKTFSVQAQRTVSLKNSWFLSLTRRQKSDEWETKRAWTRRRSHIIGDKHFLLAEYLRSTVWQMMSHTSFPESDACVVLENVKMCRRSRTTPSCPKPSCNLRDYWGNWLRGLKCVDLSTG